LKKIHIKKPLIQKIIKKKKGMRSGSIGPDKLGLALDLIKKRPERRSLIFLKFNRAKDVLSTIVSLKKKKKTDDTSSIPPDNVSFENPRI
jgi:hypothetical protein